MTSPYGENLIRTYIESLITEKGFSKHTCRAYRHDLEEFFAFLNDGQVGGNDSGEKEQKVGPGQVDGLMIRGYLGFLYRKNAKTTVARKLSAIRSFFRYLVRCRVLDDNPAEMINTPKQDKTIPTYLAVDDMFTQTFAKGREVQYEESQGHFSKMPMQNETDSSFHPHIK